MQYRLWAEWIIQIVVNVVYRDYIFPFPFLVFFCSSSDNIHWILYWASTLTLFSLITVVFFSRSCFPGRNLSFCCWSLLHQFPCVTTCTAFAALKHILLNYDILPGRFGTLCNNTLFSSLFKTSVNLYNVLTKILNDRLNTHNMIID